MKVETIACIKWYAVVVGADDDAELLSLRRRFKH